MTLRCELRRLLGFGVLLTVASFALAGCGSDDNSGSTTAKATDATCTSASVNGSGSTFAQNIVKEWIKNYGAACKDASINYQGTGSSDGINNFTNATVEFAGTDVPLSTEEKLAAQDKRGAVLTIPWTAGAVAVIYNLPGVENLQLKPATLAGIYAGAIKKWNDAAIAADNPGVTLPGTGIQVVHRSDGSGTTAVFTSYLAAVAPQVWKAGSGKAITWPTGQGAQKSDKLTETVKSTPGAIGYAELSYAVGSKMPTVRLGNAGGAYVAPDAPGAVTAALAQATVSPDLQVSVNYQAPDAAAYPLSSVSYVLVPARGSDANKAALLRNFITYALGQGQDSAAGLAYAPLPASLVTQAKTTAATITGP
jgi:phosphate transport system substrate-binding protein